MKLREEFGNQRDASDPAEIAGLLSYADEIEEVLRENVVQGRLNERESSRALDLVLGGKGAVVFDLDERGNPKGEDEWPTSELEEKMGLIGVIDYVKDATAEELRKFGLLEKSSISASRLNNVRGEGDDF